MEQVSIPYRVLRDISLVLPEEQIWRLAGVRRGGGEVRPALREACQQAILKARSLIRPQALWVSLALSRLDSEGVWLEKGQRLSSPTLARVLRGGERLVLALVSIGGDLEAETRRLLEEGEYLEGMLLDAIGSVAVSEVGDGVRERLAQEATAAGLQMSRSWAPGWQCWPLEDQGVLFDLLPAAQIGVTLTPSYLMIPEKSETFVVGLGRDIRVKHEPATGCRFCDRLDCAFRQAS